MRLWIDDLRKDPDTDMAGIAEPQGWAWVKNVADALAWLEENQSETIEQISFDHDLGYGYLDSATVIDGGGKVDDGKFSTTRPILMWMIENDVWPKKITVHSANPVGREWLIGTALRYAPEWVNVSPH